MSLTLRQVAYSYRREGTAPVRALAPTSVSFEAGEVTLVAGATGSGKSTLLRITSGLLAPDEGAVELDGRALDRDRAAGAVGLVFQSPENQLFADTVIDDVSFGPRNLGASPDDARARAADALRRLELDPELYGHRSPFSLSGGEARRAAIAGVIAMQPRFLLLDEPTAGLDAVGRAALAEIVERGRAESGIVVVSHDLDDWLPRVDRVVLLADGGLSFSGSVDDLLRTPDELSAAGLLPPAVLDVQMQVHASGLLEPPFTMDVDDAAAALAGARPS